MDNVNTILGKPDGRPCLDCMVGLNCCGDPRNANLYNIKNEIPVTAVAPIIRRRPKQALTIPTTALPTTTPVTVNTGAAFDFKTFAQDNALLLLLAAGGIGYLLFKDK